MINLKSKKSFIPAFITALCLAVSGAVLLAQEQEEPTVRWSSRQEMAEDGSVNIIFTGKCQSSWHTYSITDEYNATSVVIESSEGCELIGEPVSSTPFSIDEYGFEAVSGQIDIAVKVKPLEASASIKGYISWVACTNGRCVPPEEWEFREVISAAPAASPAGELPTSFWALLLEAILWGFAMILTPCVFPMIPMTVSYFLKNSSSASEGRLKALIYGLFIILIYTVPVLVIIALTRIIGGEMVTADLFNWLSTHWIPNVLFFVVFIVFAASFFGAFEITLPSKLVNRSDAKSDKKGLAGIFFMALTLVLVSFSCTGPIVGTVLIKSTQGEFWMPVLTMLAFSTAFALGFTFFAAFPTLLKNGPWMNSVKVVFGFLELAFGLKFLSVADQTYHWHLLDREIYLAIWIVIFTMLGFYLLGKLRFKYDSETSHIGPTRLILAIATFSFVVYMIPGMWGAPLKGSSGFLPPLETQDFVIGRGTPSQDQQPSGKYGLKMPLGLSGYFDIEEALEASVKENKPVFVDITGHGCVNCREMEARVWSDNRVLSLLRDKFIMVALYTDDKTSLPQEEWVTTESGKVLKDLGRVNAHKVRQRFGVNAQPNYTILDSNGRQLVPMRGYNLDVEAYLEYLNQGLEAFYSTER